METIGQRINRLRIAKGLSLAGLGREMAKAIGRPEPFSGELIRLYEEDENRPSVETRSALAKVFERSEIYIEFGVTPEGQTVREPTATYSAEALELAREFDRLSTSGRHHVRRTVELAKYSDMSPQRRAAAQQDATIKKNRLQVARRAKTKKPVRKRTRPPER